MADRKYGEPAPPTSERISGADWYGQELLRKEYSNTLFVDIDLTEVQSSGCVFNECTFRRARFNASIHKDSAFVNCTFVSCNFFDSKFLECKLLGSMFDDCQFHHMQVIGGDWGFVGLPGADLSRASDVPPILSSTAIWSPIPNDKEIGREEAFYRRADHRLPA